MAENRFPGGASPCGSRDMVCIETNRVLDSCRDRDCYEFARVYLSEYGNEILSHTGAIRVRSATILKACIGMDPIQFNHGFYAVNIRFFVRVCFEACVSGNRSQELLGLVVLEKRVILYGGESNVSIYRSCGDDGSFCSCPKPQGCERNLPTATVEVVDPVVLGCKIVERVSDCGCSCSCCEEDLDEGLLRSMDGPLCFDEGRIERYLTVSLGIFSVVRITRQGQYLVQATECAIPEKECCPVEEDDPCHVFRNMPFPIGEFGIGGFGASPVGESHKRCGC